MKLTALLLTVAALQVSAGGFSQRLTLDLQNVSMQKAFKEIRKQTGFVFFYQKAVLDGAGTVSIQAKDASIEEVLNKCFSGQQLDYNIIDRTIVVKEKPVIIEAEKRPKQLSPIEVSGVITDENGTPLSGASVKLKGSDRGTTTDATGHFKLAIPGQAGILEISYVGYETTEVAVSKSGDISVALKPKEIKSEEIVVVGYGSQRKASLTGAVDQISGKQLAERPIANVFQGLQGVSPGLNLTYMGGQPGQTPTINVRGFTSINGGSPLVVIDGITAATDDLLRLNPSDIASITVLRDAASAAIYGARAAYGVLLVTTKEGASGGRQTISYSNYFAWSKPTILPEAVTDPYIYSRVLETATDNTPWDYVNYSDEYYKWAKERSDNPSIEDVRVDPSDPTKWAYMGSNNWNDYFFSKTSFSQYHTLSFSGSSESGKKLPMSYLLSADYTKENGLNKITKDDWNRYGLRGRINFSPVPWLKLDNNLNVYQLERDAPTYSATDIYYLQPTNVVKNPDGTWGNNAAGILAAQLTDGGRNQQNRFGFQNIMRGVGQFF